MDAYDHTRPLGENLDREIARIKARLADNNEGRRRDTLLDLLPIEKALHRAEAARESGDAIKMINAYHELWGFRG